MKIKHSKLILPNYLIIGTRRAGTTWLAENLGLHPDIFMAGIKEIHFFDRNWDKGLDYYGQFFEKVTTEKVIGEATPAYLHTLGVETLIKQALGELKMIAILRNPVDRLYSNYWNNWVKSPPEHKYTFEEKIRRNPEMVEVGYYFDHLIRYYEIFPKQKILVLLFDELIFDETRLLSKVYAFLDVDGAFKSPAQETRINSADSKPGLNHSPFAAYALKALRKLKLYRLYNFIDTKSKKPLPDMKKGTRSWLIEDIYFEKNQKLQDLIGMDLSNWNH